MEDYAKFMFISKRNKKTYLVNSRHLLEEDDLEELFPTLDRKLKKGNKK